MRKEELSEFIFQAMQTFDNAHVMVWFDEAGIPAECFAVGTKYVAVGTFEDDFQPKLLLKEVKDIEKIVLLYDNGDMETLYPPEEN